MNEPTHMIPSWDSIHDLGVGPSKEEESKLLESSTFASTCRTPKAKPNNLKRALDFAWNQGESQIMGQSPSTIRLSSIQHEKVKSDRVKSLCKCRNGYAPGLLHCL
jgi:hypothetical protein